MVDSSNDFTLYGIELRNSPNFHVMVSKTDGFTAWGVRIDAPASARNTDGIDPSSSTNVSIAHSYIRAGDDNVAIKAGNGGPATHITIAHNHFYSGHGMSIGSETNGGVSNVLVSDLAIDGADNGIRIKSDLSRGGLVHDVTYKDVCIRDVKNPITISPFYTQAAGTLVPVYQDISLQNVRSVSPGKIEMIGIDSQHPLGVSLDGVEIDHLSPRMCVSRTRISRLGPGRLASRCRVTTSPSLEATVTKEPRPNSACKDSFTPFPAAATVHPVEKSMADEEPERLYATLRHETRDYGGGGRFGRL